MVPEGWSKASLGDVVNYKKGFAFDSSDYSENGVRVIRISDTTRDGLHSNNPKYVAEDRADGFSDWQLFGGDIIVSTVGSRPHLLDSMVGKAVRIPANFKGSLLNQNLVKLAPKKDRVISEILYPHLKDNRFITFISGLVRGNANQVSITLKELFTFPILLPPLPEQQKIADILSTWDQAIEKTEALLSNARTQKRALMQQLLTGKRRFSAFEGQPWREVRLGDVVSLSKSRLDPRRDHNTRRCIEMEHIEAETGRLLGSTSSDKQASIKAVFGLGDVLFGKLRPYLRKFHAPDFEGVCSTEIWVLQPKADTLLSSYLHGLVQSAGLMTEAEKSAGSKMPRADWKIVSDYRFMLPSLAEQEAISKVIDDMGDEIDVLHTSITKLRTEKKALMQQLLTGKRRVMVEDHHAV